MEKIEKTQTLNQKQFWRLVNKGKKKSGRLHPIELTDGTILTDPQEQSKAWKQYFEELYTPTDNVNYDNDFKMYIDNEITRMEKDSMLNDDCIMSKELTLQEVQNVIAKLKCNTAPGWDEVTTEHVKYGGLELIKSIRRLFNVISKYEYICPFISKEELSYLFQKG